MLMRRDGRDGLNFVSDFDRFMAIADRRVCGMGPRASWLPVVDGARPVVYLRCLVSIVVIMWMVAMKETHIVTRKGN